MKIILKLEDLASRMSERTCEREGEGGGGERKKYYDGMSNREYIVNVVNDPPAKQRFFFVLHLLPEKVGYIFLHILYKKVNKKKFSNNKQRARWY